MQTRYYKQKPEQVQCPEVQCPERHCTPTPLLKHFTELQVELQSKTQYIHSTPLHHSVNKEFSLWCAFSSDFSPTHCWASVRNECSRLVSSATLGDAARAGPRRRDTHGAGRGANRPTGAALSYRWGAGYRYFFQFTV